MKSLLFLMTAVSLGLTCTILGGDSYSTLAEQGYRWVAVNGPFACITEQNVERITTHHTDAVGKSETHTDILPRTTNLTSSVS